MCIRDSAKVDHFFNTMKKPIDFAQEVGEGNDTKQLSTIGKFGAVISAFIFLMLFIPNPAQGRIAILTLALTIGIISALLIRAGSKSKNV